MSTMLQGCSDASVVEELLGELDWQGLTPNLEVLTSMLGCLRRAGAVTNKTWEVLKLAKSCELKLDCQFLVQAPKLPVVTALGFANDTGAVVLLMESVREVYKVEPDVFLYTAAIAQCARAGDVAGAETIISLMQRSEVEPNEHTHCAIIAVYSKAGKLLEAVRHFQEANEKVALPIEGYTSILSGCRAALDNRCALQILKLGFEETGLQGPVKSACYTLARQSCALAGDEAGAAKVDKWQKRDGVVTHVPTSTVDDPSTGERLPFQDNPVSYRDSGRLRCDHRGSYKPQLWQYDPEISQEEREDRLQFHTEKKALAWALKHFPKGSSITVRKTIRCCVDCHNAFKVASKAYGRTLRILDQAEWCERVG
ncbi:PCMP-H87 [Symbiodinium sp. CCMP2592]|nr:PCMP-H87 [Symbiodinium sp. CCMP2592]